MLIFDVTSLLQTQLESQKNQTWNAINQTWLVIGIFSAILIAWGLFQHFDIRKQKDEIRQEFNIDETQDKLTRLTEENIKSRDGLLNTIVSIYEPIFYTTGYKPDDIAPIVTTFYLFVLDHSEAIKQNRILFYNVVSQVSNLVNIFENVEDYSLILSNIAPLSKTVISWYDGKIDESKSEELLSSNINNIEKAIKMWVDNKTIAE